MASEDEAHIQVGQLGTEMASGGMNSALRDAARFAEVIRKATSGDHPDTIAGKAVRIEPSQDHRIAGDVRQCGPGRLCGDPPPGTARISAPALIALACAAGILRWSMIGLAETASVAMLAQLLQGATLGFTQLGAAQYIRTRVPEQVISSGTGLYAACAGLLTASCVLLGSFLFASVGGRAFLLTSAMCGAGLAAALALQAHEARQASGLDAG
ncbi:MFS transporter [Cupriavidus sp. 2MCAB6]|uniref:MFS transporter n=1 Tax=Cupriavidus sp. 2MCAB6 TaxID=3232981 RepID=UPI003F8E738E